jgi:hypothetical protein
VKWFIWNEGSEPTIAGFLERYPRARVEFRRLKRARSEEMNDGTSRNATKRQSKAAEI